MAMRPDMPSIRVSRRGKIVIGVLVSLFVLLSVLGSLVRVYTNWLWFGEVGYRSVFSTILVTRIVLFVIVGLVMALIIGTNVFLAYRMRPPFRPISQEQENLERYRVALEPRKRLIFGALVALIFLVAGMSAQSNWKTWQLWRNGVSFGIPDPQFHRDISFFAWDYPAYRLLLGLAFNAVIFSLLLSLAVHYVFGAFRIATPGPKLTISARRHVTLLVFFFIVLKACAYWLDRYGLVFSGRGKVTGASYTDVNASLPAKTILFWVAVLIALAVLASLWLKSAQIPIISFVVLLILSIGINGIYPAIVQQVTVKPNASDKEVPYIGRNIEATRQAYGIVKDKDGGTVTYQDYKVTTRPDNAALTSADPTVSNLRILDPNVVSPTFSKFQQLRNQYGFSAKLDIDRYEVDGEVRDYVVGVRELDQSKLNGNQTNWINAHTFYTHGYGFAAAAASSDVTNTKEFSEGDIPPKGPLDLSTPQVYYGELLPSYSIVGASGAPREYDGSDVVKTTYAGSGGVPMSNIFKRLAFGMKYRETNFLLNDAVSAKGAKIIFDRNPRQRVEKVAPFLTVDGDPYPAVIDGRVTWILDGYTTSGSYPYSEQMELGEAAADALTGTGTTALPNDTVNYIRNSVKATVDAYDGTVTLYEWDTGDPVLQTYMKAFPGLVQPREEMSPDLVGHVRYPEDLFKVQRDILTRYHVSDPGDFYSGNDRWAVPADPTQDTQEPQPPYYILAQRPGDPQASFQLTSALNAFRRENLSSFVSASSAPDTYGQIQVLTLPGNTPFRGPQQVQQSFITNNQVRPDLTLFNSAESRAVFGNLLTLPIGDNGLLYVEPLYVEGTGENSFPLLQKVLVNYGDRVGYANTLAEALDQVFGAGAGEAAVDNDEAPPTTDQPDAPATPTPLPPADGGTETPSTPEMQQAVEAINNALAALQTAQRNGDFAGQGQALEDLQGAVTAYQTAQAQAAQAATPGG